MTDIEAMPDIATNLSVDGYSESNQKTGSETGQNVQKPGQIKQLTEKVLDGHKLDQISF